MPPPWPSASAAAATRLANHWIVDALAADESVEFPVIQELVRNEPLVTAPEATRQRVSLRALQEASSAYLITADGGDAAATAGVLRVHGAPSFEDVLRQVESSGILEKNLLPPFSQNIQEIIRTTKLALPETSFQLLKGVDPLITFMTTQSQLEHNSAGQCDIHQSLCSSHECVNIEKPVFPTDNAVVLQETMANLVNEGEKGNLQKDPPVPTSVLHQPCSSESRSYVPPQEDMIDAVGLGARSPERNPIVEGNIPVGSVSIAEPFTQLDKHDLTATVEPKSCRQKSPKLPHCADVEGADGCGSSNQSCKISSHEGPSTRATVAPGFDRISDVVPTDASEPGDSPECINAQDTSMISQPDSRKAHLSAVEHERGEKVNQDLEDVSASIRPVEKDHVHGDLTLQSATVLLSISCNVANQGSKSETNLQPRTTEDRMAFEEQNADKSHLEVSGANKANQALHDDGSIMKNNTIHGGLSAETAPVPQNCNVTLHDKTSEANCFPEQKNGKNRTDLERDNYRTSIPSSSKHRDGESAKKTSNEEKSEDISPEIRVRLKDLDIDDTLEDLSQQDLCMKCRKDGQLLKCSGCILAAHDSCFGSSATFEETNLFYCPVCIFEKAQEAYEKSKTTYCEAKDNLFSFLGTTQVIKQHDEQLTGIQPGANSKTRVMDPEKKQQVGDKEARKEAGNDNSSPETRASSQRRCDRPSNQDGEADQEDSLIGCNQFGGSDELEATYNDSGKRSSPPWRNMRHNKRRFQEKESAVPSKSRKGIAKQDQHMPTSSRKRKSVHPQKRYSKRVAPDGRRHKVAWTPAEEACLREAMEKFAPQNDAQIPWVRILGYGRHVFHIQREASDLRVKWRNMMKKNRQATDTIHMEH